MTFLQGTYYYSLLFLLLYVRICFIPFCFLWHNSPTRTQTASLLRLMDHTKLDRLSHRHYDFYERVIHQSQGPLHTQNTNTTDERPCLYRNLSNKTAAD